jgi:hypothetical protein
VSAANSREHTLPAQPARRGGRKHSECQPQILGDGTRANVRLVRISMNTTLSGSARVDDIKGYPQGEIRGLTTLVRITQGCKNVAQSCISLCCAVLRGRFFSFRDVGF